MSTSGRVNRATCDHRFSPHLYFVERAGRTIAIIEYTEDDALNIEESVTK